MKENIKKIVKILYKTAIWLVILAIIAIIVMICFYVFEYRQCVANHGPDIC